MPEPTRLEVARRVAREHIGEMRPGEGQAHNRRVAEALVDWVIDGGDRPKGTPFHHRLAKYATQVGLGHAYGHNYPVPPGVTERLEQI